MKYLSILEETEDVFSTLPLFSLAWDRHLCRACWLSLRECHLQSATKAVLRKSSVRESTRFSFFVFAFFFFFFWLCWVYLTVEIQSCPWASIAWY